jgi:hypothetical protein
MERNLPVLRARARRVDNLVGECVMRLVRVAVCTALLCCTLTVGLSQQPPDAEPLQLALRADAVVRQPKPEHPQVTASFEYTRSHQERLIRQLVEQIQLHDELQRSLELKGLNQSPITTILDLERFLSPKAYKRADGSPLIDLTF